MAARERQKVRFTAKYINTAPTYNRNFHIKWWTPDVHVDGLIDYDELK